MSHNDVLRSLRFLLDVNDVGIANLFALGGLEVPLADVDAYLRRDDEAGFVECPDRAMAHFLDGLITDRRGRRDAPGESTFDPRVTNNVVLKKLRIAFALKDTDVLELMERSGVRISKHELSALFRQPGHPNYRPCGDQFLRNFLKALAAEPQRFRATGR